MRGCVYTGPATKWGLAPDTRCEIIGKRAGGYVVGVLKGPQAGGRFVVAAEHLRLDARLSPEELAAATRVGWRDRLRAWVRRLLRRA